MNMLVKRLAKAMGANVTEKSLQRAARSVLALNKVTEGIADDCSKKKRSGLHSQKNPEEAVKIIAHGLLMGQVFQKKEHRKGYPHFPNLNPTYWMLTIETSLNGSRRNLHIGNKYMNLENFTINKLKLILKECMLKAYGTLGLEYIVKKFLTLVYL